MARKFVRIALRTSLLYALFSALWIALSDHAVVVIWSDPHTIGRIATYKGWVFVAVTALLLYGTLRRQLHHEVREIEKRRMAEEALGRYELMASHTSDIILFVREDDKRILEANNAALKNYGYSRVELLTLTINDLRAIETRPLIAGQMAEAEAHGTRFETTHRRKDGSTFPVEVSSQGANIDGTRILISVVRDVTTRKQMEDELRRSRDELGQRVAERTAELSSTNRLLHLFTMQSSRKEYLDEVVKLLQEWTACEAVGLRVLDKEGHIPYESWVGFGTDFMQAENYISLDRDRCVCIRVVAGAAEPYEMPYRTAKGSFHCDDMGVLAADFTVEERFRGKCLAAGYASVTVIPVIHREKILGIIHLADRQVAKVPRRVVEFIESAQALIGEALYRYHLEEEGKRLEEHLRQAHKMEAIGTLAGGVAHDFNNMLAVIIGSAELALDDLDDNHRPTRHIEQIMAASKRARDLVRQILTFSRKTEKQTRTLCLTPLVMETYRLLRSSLPANIDMQLDLQAVCDTVTGDPSQIQQVLMNLATNAAHAMQTKGGLLLIGLSDVWFAPGDKMPEADMRPGRYLKLAVQDTGTGISQAVQQRMFDPFFTTKEAGKGTGMGLAVVYGIVKSHGGAISVTSTAGEGSTFSVFLPCSAEGTKEDRESETAIPGGNEKILVIDNETDLAQTVSEMLGRLGYDVTAETDATGALTRFLSEPCRFDLIVTDQAMPGLTGIELARKMLEVRKGQPIILITGHSEAVSSQAAKSMGISEFLMKPFVKQQVAGTVRRVLDNRNFVSLNCENRE